MDYGQRLAQLIDAATASELAEDGLRYHLGGSVIGSKCMREVWLSYRWAAREEFEGRMLRLFNRGHREEEVFATLFRRVGATVWTADANGQQYRVKCLDGHGGGSLDGVAINLPDLPAHVPNGAAVLCEMKTHNDKQFKNLVKKGVRTSHPKHYKQAQFYMHNAGLKFCLYCAVNKNDDSLHFEFFDYDPATGNYLTNRGETIIFGSGIPPRISENPSWFECTFCAMRGVCFKYTDAFLNCRTCRHSAPQRDGTWSCALGHHEITTNPKQGCLSHDYLPELKR